MIMMSPLILSMLKSLIQKKMAGQAGQAQQQGEPPPMLQRHMPPEQLQRQVKLQQLMQILQSRQQQGGQQPNQLALLLSLFGGRR